jgi:hypothetical protein
MPEETHNAPYLDCCADPQVASVRLVYQECHDMETLCQCQNCGVYWFWRFHEYVSFTDEDDDWTVWYSRLTPEQGRLILEAKERPDLPFLSDAPSYVKDRTGVRQVTGQPTYPWS